LSQLEFKVLVLPLGKISFQKFQRFSFIDISKGFIFDLIAPLFFHFRIYHTYAKNDLEILGNRNVIAITFQKQQTSSNKNNKSLSCQNFMHHGFGGMIQTLFIHPLDKNYVLWDNILVPKFKKRILLPMNNKLF